ncbi:RecQ family ATP-dependent DNA helicase [Paramuribaculum intestinale]|uniref:RecQ family ATP-dependent DNA helicase n=1 Tax=Paramuribaculum intestinale TaxID=2094151 RepID=UPI0025A931FF|nr:ATP-dependent DNA helicase RecQ [Paramuribaculum intestinale]
MMSRPDQPTPEEILRKYWGYDSFRPLQGDIIASVLSGHDTLGLLPTGGGKSLTFQVPGMILPGLTVVVTPLISLMTDQVDNLARRGIRAVCLHSGLTRAEHKLGVDRCNAGHAKFLYISPEKLQSDTFLDTLRHIDVSLIVVDEAHCISQWGYDFRPSYLNIARLRTLFPDVPLLALTASATPEVRADIMERLGFEGRRVFAASFARSNISYIVRAADHKDGLLLKALRGTSGSAIVYVRSRRRTREIADMLQAEGISAAHYHAGLEIEEKNERQKQWKEGHIRVMVATNAFGMGIDKPDVRFVAHYDLPPSLEEYYQEAGRAGRDGKPSYALTIASRHDRATLMRRLADAFPPRDFIKEIYSQVCVSLGIAIGDGYNAVYEFDLDEFCRRFGRQPRMTRSAIELLARSGYWQYVDDVASRSRIMITMRRDELYGLRLEKTDEDVLQQLLRTYTGLFADYVAINENQIAGRLGLTADEIYQSLLSLGRHHVASYVPASNKPYIYFLTSRDEQRYVQIPVSVYEQRREVMKRRLDAMADFVFNAGSCRVARMLQYFGEKDACRCGNCDVCRESRQSTPGQTADSCTMEQTIVYIASQPGGHTLDHIALQLQRPVKELIPVVRRMLDEGVLRLEGLNIISNS